MADEPSVISETDCSSNSRLLELPDEVLRIVLCFLSGNSSDELDQNPLLPLRVVCKVLRDAVDNNLTTFACFTKFSSDDDAAWAARVREQMHGMLPKWRELRRLRWHLLLPAVDFKALLEAMASTRPDLRELELLADDHDPAFDNSAPVWWRPRSYLFALMSFHSLQKLTINLHPFKGVLYNLEVPALPSLQVLRIEGSGPVILGHFLALTELRVSARWPSEAKMSLLGMSARLARLSLHNVEFDHNLLPPVELDHSLQSLQLHQTITPAHGSLHLRKHLVHLTDLDLNGVGKFVRIDGDRFSLFMRLAKLQSLKLDCASVRGSFDLSSQTSLTSLTLTGNQKSYHVSAPTLPFPELAPLRSLRQLEVAEFQKDSLDLHGLSALEQLSIASCIQLKTLVGLEDLTRVRTPSLKNVTFHNLGRSPVNVGALTALKSLALDNTFSPSGWSVPSSLKRLEYSNYLGITFAELHEIFCLPSDVEVVVKPPLLVV